MKPFFIFIAVLTVATIQLSLQPTTQKIEGRYVLLDTANKKTCFIHQLKMYNDSTFEYQSPCQNSYGKWKIKGTKLFLIPDLQTLFCPWYVGSNYFPTENYVSVTLVGKSIRITPSIDKISSKSGHPMVCEEIISWYNGTEKSGVTDKSGNIIFNGWKTFDSLQLVSLSNQAGLRMMIRKKTTFPDSKCNNLIIYFPSFSNNYHQYIFSPTPIILDIKNNTFISKQTKCKNGIFPAGNWNYKPI